MGVEQHLEEGVHVPAFCLKLLRHRHTDDFAPVDFAEIKGAFVRTKDLCDVRRQEVLEIIGDGLLHTANLFGWLIEETVFEMLAQYHTPFRLIPTGQIVQRSSQVRSVQ